MLKKLFCVLFGITIVLSCSGCYDAEKPENISFVTAIGIDRGISSSYKITFQGIVADKMSGGKASGDQIYNISVEAADFQSAINLSHAFFADKLSFIQTKLIVFSEEVAKEDQFKNFIDYFDRQIAIRPDCYVAVSTSGAFDFLNSVKSSLNSNPTKYYDLMFQNLKGNSVTTSLNDVYSNLVSREKESVLPLAAVNHAEKKTKLMKYIYAGNIVRTGQNLSDILGMVVVGSNGKMAAKASADEAKYFNMLSGEAENVDLSLDNGNKTPILTEIKQVRKPQYDVSLINQIPHIHINLKYTLNTLTYFGNDKAKGLNTPYVENKLKDEMKIQLESLLYKTSRKYKSDIFGFYRIIKRNYKDYHELQKINWDKLYPHAEFSISIDIEEKRAGQTITSDKEDNRGY